MASSSSASSAATGLKPGFPGVLHRYYTIWERYGANRSNAGGTLLASHTNGLAVLFVGENHGLRQYCAANGTTITKFQFCDGSESEAAAVSAAVRWVETELDGYTSFSHAKPSLPAPASSSSSSTAAVDSGAVAASMTMAPPASAVASSLTLHSTPQDAHGVPSSSSSSLSSSSSSSSSSESVSATDASERLPRAMRKRASHKDAAVNVRDFRVTGGGKKGAPKVRVRTPLGLATLSDGRVWPLLSGVSGGVYETNKRLEERPELLLQGIGMSGLGYIGIVALDVNLRRRLVADDPPSEWRCIHRAPQVRKLAADEDDD